MTTLANTNLQTDSIGSNYLMNNCSNGDEAEKLRKRLQSYTNYVGKKNAVHLAAAGFVYAGTSDKVVCESCGIRLFNWIGEEDALQEHRKYSPDCSFIRSKFNTTFDSASVKSDVGFSSYTTKSTLSSVPKYKDYMSYEQRVDSFTGWPLKQPCQKPSVLAQSGFFYIGSADRARCFHCGLTLRDWDDDDFPPAVHQEWSKDCEFAKKLNVEEMRRVVENESTSTLSSDKTDCGVSDNKTVKTNSFVKPSVSVVSQATHEDSCSSNYGYNPAIQAVIEMGYSIEIINTAIENRKKKDGSDFPNAVALFEAVMDLED